MDAESERAGAPTDFDPVWYLQTYPDVRASGIDPLDHYKTIGHSEGRQGAPVRALELDHMLWRGFSGTALPALEALLVGADPRERAIAGWALSRWYWEKGESQTAHAAILAFHAVPEGPQTLRYPGPFLLGIQCCLECDDPSEAETLLRAGRQHFGALPDFELAELLIRRWYLADDEDLTECLARLHAPHGLTPVTLNPVLGRSRFDRLSADSTPFASNLPDTLPKVSVIVPVFNGAKGLATALRSLSAQSWPNLELLVVDDGSSDDSRDIATAMAARDPRIRLVTHDSNKGAYVARNTGFAEATGDFVTVHDADDWSHPQKIEMQLRPLLDHPALKATVSHWVRMGDDLQMTRWRMEDRWVYRNVSSLMVRADLRETLGYWDRVRVNADTEYYYRIIASHGHDAILEVCPGIPLSFGRTHARSLTNQSATHLRTQFKGVRRDYMEAAHAWHERHRRNPEGLYMPRAPKERPFRVPHQIALGDPEGPLSDYDLLSASALLDEAWYWLSSPDVLMADIGAVRHYLSGGARENRDPGPLFSSGGYRHAQGLSKDDNPLVHFETAGRAAGAAPLPSFRGALYGQTDDQPCTLIFAHTSGKTLFGAERSLLAVLERLARRGRNPVVVVPALRNFQHLEALLRVSVAVEVLPQVWRHAMRPPVPETVGAIRALIKKYQPQELHVNTIVLDAPLAAARAEGVPSVVTVRELPAEDVALRRGLGATAEQLRNALLAEADRFIATSRPVADWLGCPDRTDIRPNSVDEDLFDMAFSPQKTLRVALISSNVAKKGLSDFLSVARLVAVERRDIRFLLIGPPTLDLSLMQPFPPNVEFRGYALSPRDAVAQADIVMSLSKFAESFGRTVLEAMAAGRPVICYDRGTPPSLVESGATGFVVPADNPQAAANAVLALDVARGQLQIMSKAARRAARHFQELALQG